MRYLLKRCELGVRKAFEAICGFPPCAPALAAVASLKGMKSGSEIDRLAQPNNIDGLSHNTWQVGERQDSLILNVYTTVNVFSKCSWVYLCVPATAPSRNYIVGDTEEYCVGYSQTIILENKKNSCVLVMFLQHWLKKPS